MLFATVIPDAVFKSNVVRGAAGVATVGQGVYEASQGNLNQAKFKVVMGCLALGSAGGGTINGSVSGGSQINASGGSAVLALDCLRCVRVGGRRWSVDDQWPSCQHDCDDCEFREC